MLLVLQIERLNTRIKKASAMLIIKKASAMLIREPDLLKHSRSKALKELLAKSNVADPLPALPKKV